MSFEFNQANFQRVFDGVKTSVDVDVTDATQREGQVEIKATLGLPGGGRRDIHIVVNDTRVLSGDEQQINQWLRDQIPHFTAFQNQSVESIKTQQGMENKAVWLKMVDSEGKLYNVKNTVGPIGLEVLSTTEVGKIDAKIAENAKRRDSSAGNKYTLRYTQLLAQFEADKVVAQIFGEGAGIKLNPKIIRQGLRNPELAAKVINEAVKGGGDLSFLKKLGEKKRGKLFEKMREEALTPKALEKLQKMFPNEVQKLHRPMIFEDRPKEVQIQEIELIGKDGARGARLRFTGTEIDELLRRLSSGREVTFKTPSGEPISLVFGWGREIKNYNGLTQSPMPSEFNAIIDLNQSSFFYVDQKGNYYQQLIAIKPLITEKP